MYALSIDSLAFSNTCSQTRGGENISINQSSLRLLKKKPRRGVQ